jgi:hypothetical protein
MYPAMPPAYWSEDDLDGTGCCFNEPSDRSFVMSSGPFALEPGETDQMLFAIVWSQADRRHTSAFELKRDALAVRTALWMGFPDPPGPPEPTALPAPPTFALGHCPNPVEDRVRFGYELPEDTWAAIRVYDVLGRRILEAVSGVHQSGTYDVVLHTSGLPAGLYIYRLETPRFIGNRKMIVVN